ncbi:hypothetical protein V5D56_06900 [Cellulosimicrobium sp. PMB13]|uniref:hypothetical protein n=1 Tax=Cellulosimicrobium sp. PMB13 TaxID=3120158 RepID=UPI003F4BFE16
MRGSAERALSSNGWLRAAGRLEGWVGAVVLFSSGVFLDAVDGLARTPSSTSAVAALFFGRMILGAVIMVLAYLVRRDVRWARALSLVLCALLVPLWAVTFSGSPVSLIEWVELCVLAGLVTVVVLLSLAPSLRARGPAGQEPERTLEVVSGEA